MDRSGPPADSRNHHRLTTARLDLELPHPTDAPVLFELVGGAHRREVCATLMWDGPDDVPEVESWIERCHTETLGDWGYHWVIRDRAGTITGRAGGPVGNIGTRPRDAPGRVDVGYWLGRPYCGQGIMGEALAAVVDLDFDQLGCEKVEADVFAHNDRGCRLAERLGMKREGVIRGAFRKYGEWVDVAVYGLLADERSAG